MKTFQPEDFEPDRPGKIVDSLIELAARQAHTILIGSKEQLMACFVVATTNGIFFYGCPWKDDAEKNQMVTEVARQIKKRKAYAYSFLTEAWSASAPEGWDPQEELAEADRAKNRADRREVVIALAVDRQGARRLVRWSIERDPFGACSELREQEPERTEEPAGWDSWIGDLFSN